MQSHFGGLALDIPQQQRGLNEKEATEAEAMTLIPQKPKGTRPGGWKGDRVLRGITIPGSRISWLQGGEMVLNTKREGRGEKWEKEGTASTLHRTKGVLHVLLFLQLINRGGTSSPFAIYISPEQHQLYFNINVTQLIEISNFSSH